MRRALLIVVAVSGCVLEANPAFVASDGSSGSASTTTGTALTVTSSGDASTGTTTPTTDAPATTGNEDTTTSTEPAELDVEVLEVGEASFEAVPRLAWSGSELGVSWDVHQQFARFDVAGESLGLVESPLNLDAKNPHLTALDGRFYGGYVGFSSEVFLLERQATDTWVSLGRKDEGGDSLSVVVTPFNGGLVMAWRQLVIEMQVILVDAKGNVLATDQQPLGSAHRPFRFLPTEDSLYLLIEQDEGLHSLMRYDHALTYMGREAVNDGPTDVVLESDGFSFAAARDGRLVLAAFDGQAIQGELTQLEPRPGEVHEVRMLGRAGRYLVAWSETGADRVGRIYVGRARDGQGFEKQLIVEGVVSLSDLISITDDTAALGWGVPDDAVYVGMVRW